MNQAKPPNGEVSTGISVLLIEDDLVDEMALAKAVADSKLPYAITVARSVTEARATLCTHRFDIILADFSLADGTAFDLIDSFVGQLVIFTTGSGNEEVAARALELGVSDYLIKDPQRGYLKLLPWRVEAALSKSRMERQLRDSEELFRKFFHAAGGGRAIVGIDGHFLQVNQALCEMFGYTETELLEKTYQDITYPGDAAADLTIAQALIGGTITSFHKEKRYFHRDGRVVWINVTGSLERNADGTPRHFVAQIENITARKNLEESLRETQINLAEAQRIGRMGSWSWDVETDTISWSDELRHIYDLEQMAHPLAYAEHLKLYTSESASQLNAAVEKTKRTGEPYELDLERSSTGGRGQWIGARGEAIRNANGQIVGLRGTAQDITERKHAEGELKASENNLEATLAAIPDLLFEVGLDGRFHACHTTRMDLLTAPPEVFIGKLVTDVLPSDASAVAMAALQEANETGYSSGKQYLLALPQGEMCFELSIARKPTLTNEEPRFMVLSRDITERKRAVAALEESEGQLRAIIESEPACVKLVSVEGRLLRMNPAGLAMIEANTFGHVADMQVLDVVHPQDRESFQELHERVCKGQTGTLSFRVIGLRGSQRDMETRSVPLYNARGEVTSVLSVTHDITKRKQADEALVASEAKFRAIINVSPVPMALNDEEQRITFLNPAFVQTFGYDQFDIPTLAEWWPKAYPDPEYRQWVAETWRARLDQTKQTGTAFAPVELRVRSKDGTYRIVLGYAASLGNSFEGSHLVLLHDITAQKEASDTLQSSLLEKTALLKEVHHRVKNNLQVINSLLRLESRRSTVAATKAVLTDMQGRIHSMALLHELLYREGMFAAVDLGAYIRQIATESFRTLTATPDAIQLRLELAPISVVMDQAAPCGLLVGELISNCLKHGFPDNRTGEVLIELQAVAGGPQCCLRVSDTGVGLPADFEARRKRSLGLELACGLAEQLGGELKIGPAPAAVFAVTFTPSNAKLPPSLA